MTLPPSPVYTNSYMEYLVDLGHREVLLHFDDEEVDHFLIRLQQVDGVLAFAYENFSLFARQKLSVFFVDDGGVPKLE
jgi:hypothetical protein